VNPPPAQEPYRLTAEERAEGEYWDRLYGSWSPLDPWGVRDLLAGFDRPWWVIGGWSIEACTGIPREHEDVDVSILARDVAALRAHLGDAWQVWNIADGSLRPVIDRWPDVVDPESQLWLRRDARSPWVLDMPLTRDHAGSWVNKRWPEDVRPIDEATWTADDGIRYLRPEITLLFKARLQRPKDQRDLDVTWPILPAEQQAWLLDAVRRSQPDHPWLDRSGG
jgi:hypothetical protein